eukprot:6212385-Pleurochrysis_carterae.AAC.1
MVELPDSGRSGGRMRLSAVRNERCRHRLVVDWASVDDRAVARRVDGAGAEAPLHHARRLLVGAPRAVPRARSPGAQV